ncbi:TadE family protein [Streptomyces sp. URMC 127]|uniref:TadE family protein n=1 Tax=Streptomyces sp. URMC 127 TaxID=3423402 RepID=UPI003F1A3E82
MADRTDHTGRTDRTGRTGRTGHTGRRDRTGRREHTRRRDRGQASVEFIGMLPVLILIGLAVIQTGVAMYAMEQAGTAARAAARTAARPGMENGCRSAGKASISGWLAERADIRCSDGIGEVTATAEVSIPSLIGFDLGSTTKTVTMPRDTARP